MLFSENLIKNLSQTISVCNYRTQLGKALGIIILLTLDPQTKVTTLGILLLQMLQRAVPMPIIVERREIGYTVLHRATHNQFGNYQAVGFGHDTSIYRAWGMLGRGTMILHRIGHRKDLLLREPTSQHLIRHHNARRIPVVPLAAISQTRIVVRRHDIDHLLIHIEATSELRAALDDLPCMIAAVATIEAIVERQNILLDICNYLLSYHSAWFLLGKDIENPEKMV